MQHWTYLYNNHYKQSLLSFLKDFVIIQRNYDSYSNKKYEDISKQYIQIFEDTLDIFRDFFLYNNLLQTNGRHTVLLILKYNITKNSIDIYNLYNRLSEFKKKNLHVPKELYDNKYLEQFRQINLFFQKRTDIEEKYGIFCKIC